MAFSPFVSSVDLIRTGATGYFTKPSLSPPTMTAGYPRPVTISFAQNVSNCQQEGPTFYIGPNTKKDLPSQAGQGIMGHHVDEPIKCLRTQFTAYQRCELEKTFVQSQYISPQKRQSLSQQLGVSNEIIQTWFKNRRVKWRKEQRLPSKRTASTSVSTGPYFQYFGHVPYPNSKLMMRDARMLFGTASAHASYEDQ
ncbi:hypothetical protein ACROYT_G020721 [Oculina patagonica]